MQTEELKKIAAGSVSPTIKEIAQELLAFRKNDRHCDECHQNVLDLMDRAEKAEKQVEAQALQIVKLREAWEHPNHPGKCRNFKSTAHASFCKVCEALALDTKDAEKIVAEMKKAVQIAEDKFNLLAMTRGVTKESLPDVLALYVRNAETELAEMKAKVWEEAAKLTQDGDCDGRIDISLVSEFEAKAARARSEGKS